MAHAFKGLSELTSCDRALDAYKALERIAREIDKSATGRSGPDDAPSVLGGEPAASHPSKMFIDGLLCPLENGSRMHAANQG